MTKRFCDLCGEEITSWSRDDKTKWKMKYFYDKPLTNERGWCLIDAHEECLKAVAKEAWNRRMEEK